MCFGSVLSVGDVIEVLVLGYVQQPKKFGKDLRREVPLNHLNEYRFSEAEEGAECVGAGSDRRVEVLRRRRLLQDLGEHLDR